ncbi:hypothetical protein OKA04_14470 [Luteolibacter flavescens]|uniref:DUF892 family protein n=1 Tax=Luteolibacter flavescens TaxID=1859460 RepID=A0ABT3FSI0_9BACT|nr:hypothetical protein [Luteolibacter flavescens]MCW1885940.1 hypothetical protein [Luteolibacter flavescens]
MKHPLLTHYRSQLAALHETELRFQALSGQLVLSVPSLGGYLCGIESDSLQRCDSLRSLLTTLPHPRCTASVGGKEIAQVAIARGLTEKRALALEICARMHHQLINGYRVARELAHRLERHRHASRIDVMLAKMTDNFPCSKMPEETQQEFATIAG